MTTAAILGAHGQIARGLIEALPRDWDLRLFTRRPDTPHAEAKARLAPVLGYDAFAEAACELVINAAGPGDPGEHRVLGTAIADITDAIDTMVLDHLAVRPHTAYANLSTGVAQTAGPANDNAYAKAKAAAEARHRAQTGSRIADLRIFGYVSRHIDLASGFFIAQVYAALSDERVFRTHPDDFVRDYIGAEDLAGQIVALHEAGMPNGAFDAVSAAPTTKFSILDELRDQLGLRYTVDGGSPVRCVCPKRLASTGKTTSFPYNARTTSIDLVLREAKVIHASRRQANKVSSDGIA